MKNNSLEIDSVRKTFNDKLILSDVYLKCETGDIVGVLGRNGSGKSTLFKIIYGVQTADFKCLKINNKVTEGSKILQSEISYLPQGNYIPNQFSVAQAVSLSVVATRRAVFYEDEMIESVKDKMIKQLSGGELRYLEVKIILFNTSHFVLLDEPYNGLSPLMVEKVNKMISLNVHSKGVLITDHNYPNVIDVATKIVLLKGGVLHHLNDKKELIELGYLNQF
ncbi:ABC transporter [Flavobacterium faecale]|uniref:ABC transporter n=1 Tax=Flavobacterium faecale TaxID=1355330 RepID=A0A2S1LBA9_9FLAO|nr:ATP-binding cassette domain-containing protein [Flavobacterium faecale]AWG21053.1 ABC transporter [Flavobacterium faecale]